MSVFVLSYITLRKLNIKYQFNQISFLYMCTSIQVQTLNEQEWERMQQANVLANVAHAFESDMDFSDLEEDRETIFSSGDLLSPAGQADAQTLALMLQEQLDAINNEIRYKLLHTKKKKSDNKHTVDLHTNGKTIWL